MKHRLTEKYLDQIILADDQPQLIVWDEELGGFGAVIGKKATTFVANYWANGVKRRQVIGRRGGLRDDDGLPWTVTLARQRGREILGQVAGGADPSREIRSRTGGPT